jgi:hypothetical protein
MTKPTKTPPPALPDYPIEGQRQHVGDAVAKSLPRIGGPSPGAIADNLPRLGGPSPGAHADAKKR